MSSEADPQSVASRRRQGLDKRYRRERRFRAYGLTAIVLGLSALLVLFADIVSKGWPAFQQTEIQLEISWDREALGIDRVTEAGLQQARFDPLVKQALRERFPDVDARGQRSELYSLVSSEAGYSLQERLRNQPELLGKTESVKLAADSAVDMYMKSDARARSEDRQITELQRQWVAELKESGQIGLGLNTSFFTHGDSRNAEQAGMLGALVGSFYTMVVTLLLSFPIGVAAAIYLEEFAPKNRLTEIIEVNINNLAAVPSIIFGLLGLAVFINFFGLPRSVPLVGGLVLTLMALPTIIISSRSAIKAVPPSIREAALGMGASRMQVVLHHVLPLALPGMLTGTIIAMAQALGETAPLLLIGMVAFIADVPQGFTDSATVLPVQIFLWSNTPEESYVALTSAAIMVLLGFLITMNTLAVVLRKKLEKRW
jgi:phosphate transport system permease protein